MSSHKVQRSFTHVELLVVVVLLALLAAACVPFIAPAWEQERPAICLSHQRQVALAMRLYAEDEGSGFGVGSMSQWSMGLPNRSGRDAPPRPASCGRGSPSPTNDKGSGLRVQGLAPVRHVARAAGAPPARRDGPPSPSPAPFPQPLTLNPLLIETVPTFRLLHSSHATGAAMVLSALGMGEERLPSVVLIGGLEAAMYHCDCSNNRHFWDIGKGMVQWGRLNGRALTVVEKCLRSRGETERFTFAGYQQEIDAGRAVLLTLSFDAGSEEGLPAGAAARQRVSVVGVGYEGGGKELIVQLPEGLLDRPPQREQEAVEQLKSLLTAERPPHPQRRRLRWDVLSESVSNVVFTLVQRGTSS